MLRRFLPVSIIVYLLCPFNPPVSAETIVFTNGASLTAKIVAQEDEFIKVDQDKFFLFFPIPSVSTIDGKKLKKDEHRKIPPKARPEKEAAFVDRVNKAYFSYPVAGIKSFDLKVTIPAVEKMKEELARDSGENDPRVKVFDSIRIRFLYEKGIFSIRQEKFSPTRDGNMDQGRELLVEGMRNSLLGLSQSWGQMLAGPLFTDEDTDFQIENATDGVRVRFKDKDDSNVKMLFDEKSLLKRVDFGGLFPFSVDLQFHQGTKGLLPKEMKVEQTTGTKATTQITYQERDGFPFPSGFASKMSLAGEEQTTGDASFELLDFKVAP